ncbi:cation:proton antiporter [uncultured Caulobacter sp.]|uniref:cation:proton antiporter n=1 Tax=uncultured Caulobacter sp. TaxID=158749 RepID=UPI0026307346|nr:cation:proton antiporter [uncultured Caulobacter sp.]
MSFFESLLALLAAAIVLLQVSRRLKAPYPTMLAAAGVGLALIPGAPKISIEPHTALALFIAPALVDAAFDFPVRDVRRLWRPLFALAVIAVLLSAGAVAWLGVTLAGLPIAAAIALGAIVAPPDAAAATAIMSSVRMPRGSTAVLKGESLLNDATALLLFSAALAFQARGEIDQGLAIRLTLAAPGGVLLGVLLARVLRVVHPFITGTLGGNVAEFVTCFGAWLIAERLGLSPVLCLVAFAMAVARDAGLRTPPRVRIHSFAVWTSAVFLLNVLAFLLMGLQARTIVTAMPRERLMEAAMFAAAVVACLVVVRIVWSVTYLSLSKRFPILRGPYPAAGWRHGILVGWCGMRGLVTLATAFALPSDFPQRDLIVLTAFAVVLATLVLQGLTLAPLVHLLRLDGDNGLDEELSKARADMARHALGVLERGEGAAVDHWRYRFAAVTEPAAEAVAAPLEALRATGLKVLWKQRLRLEALREAGEVGPDAFLILQEELDFQEVAISRDEERQIEES